MKPAELGLDRFGHVVEARVFGAAIMERLPRLDKLDFLCPAAVTGFASMMTPPPLNLPVKKVTNKSKRPCWLARTARIPLSGSLWALKPKDTITARLP